MQKFCNCEQTGLDTFYADYTVKHLTNSIVVKCPTSKLPVKLAGFQSVFSSTPRLRVPSVCRTEVGRLSAKSTRVLFHSLFTVSE